jgi:hypothetical protein
VERVSIKWKLARNSKKQPGTEKLSESAAERCNRPLRRIGQCIWPILVPIFSDDYNVNKDDKSHKMSRLPTAIASRLANTTIKQEIRED